MPDIDARSVSMLLELIGIIVFCFGFSRVKTIEIISPEKSNRISVQQHFVNIIARYYKSLFAQFRAAFFTRFFTSKSINCGYKASCRILLIS